VVVNRLDGLALVPLQVWERQGLPRVDVSRSNIHDVLYSEEDAPDGNLDVAAKIQALGSFWHTQVGQGNLGGQERSPSGARKDGEENGEGPNEPLLAIGEASKCTHWE